MDPAHIFDNVNIGPGSTPLFNVKYLNLDYIFHNIYLFFAKFFSPNTASDSRPGSVSGSSSLDGGSSFFNPSLFSEYFRNFLYLIILLLLIIIAYIIVRMLEVRAKEDEYMKNKIKEYAQKQEEKKEKKLVNEQVSSNPRWKTVLEYLLSPVESDWKLSVMEADSMLDDLMEQLDFRGDSLGERLKNADRDKFPKLTNAWEVHAIRNKIAHEGANYILTQREAKRIIALYEQIFRDFGFI